MADCGDIVSLAALIASNVAAIQDACDARGIQLPSPSQPFKPHTIDPWADASIMEASAIIVSAAAQLIAVVRPPTATIVTTALQVHIDRLGGDIMKGNEHCTDFTSSFMCLLRSGLPYP